MKDITIKLKLFALITFFVNIFMCTNLFAQTTIVSEGLNNSSSHFTLSGGTYYSGNSASGDRPASSPFFVEGTHARGVTNNTATLTSTNNINTSTYSSIKLSLRLAAFSVGSTSNGLDDTDDVTVAISTNGGSNYTTILTVTGSSNNNSYWSYSATGVATTNYPTAATFSPSGSGNRTTDGYSTLTINSLPSSSTLKVRITLDNSSNNERWVVDDFKITGCQTATAGSDQSKCNNGSFTLAANAASAGSGAWSVVSGTANIANVSSASSGVTGVPTGTSATLRWTITNGTCTTTDDVILTNLAPPTASAGGSQTICSTGSYTLTNGEASSSNGTILWSENGAGSITAGGTTLTPTYTAAAGDIGNTVTLTMTVSNSPCSNATATYSIIVNPIATVNAGTDQTVCASSPNVLLAGTKGGSATTATWSGGSGSYNPNNTTLNATYTPSAAEITAGTVTLTLTTNDPAGPCNAVSDNMIITINSAAVASAGADQTICSGSTVALVGSRSGFGVTSSTWTSSNGGTFTNAGNTSTTYTPSAVAIAAGTVTLTITTNNPSGPCGAATDFIVVTINPPATVNAGANQTVCANESITLAGTTGGGATSATWSAPSGSFSNTSSLTSTYTPGITSGQVVLTLTSDDPVGPCASVSSTLTVTVNAVPSSVSVLPVLSTICIGENTNLTGSATTSALTTSLSDNFNSSPTFTVGGTNSGGGIIFSQQSSGYFAGLNAITNNVDSSKFMIAVASAFGSATTNSTLTSPVINTTGYTSFNLVFNHSYTKVGSSTAIVEVSTNGGGSWTTVKTYIATQGSNSNFVSDNINLNAYINQPNLKIRFNTTLIVSFGTAWWAIDNVQLNGDLTVAPLFSWSANPSATGGLPSGAGTFSNSNSSISVNPTITTSYTLTVKNPVTNCSIESAPITVVVNPIVNPTFAAVVAICSGGSLAALPTTSTNSIVGTWSPALNNLATTIYTFIPDSGQCATIPTLTIEVNDCNGQVISNIDNYIYTNLVRYADSYQWEVTTLEENGTPTGQVQTKVTKLRNLKISSLPSFAYHTLYRVRVASTVGGILGSYGSSFIVKTPLPSSTIDVLTCGTTIPTLDTYVYSTIVRYSPGYRFTLRNANNPSEVHTTEKILRAFKLSDMPNVIVDGLYDVTVEVKNTNGLYLPLISLPLCQIRIPGGTAKFVQSTTSEFNSEFNVIAYPNPFTNAFNLEVTSSINENIQVKVYDMIGRLVEQINYSISDLKTTTIGNGYQSGIYNVIVSQNEYVKTLRMIKK